VYYRYQLGTQARDKRVVIHGTGNGKKLTILPCGPLVFSKTLEVT